jgi:integral membrane sensor domain MASE1
MSRLRPLPPWANPLILVLATTALYVVTARLGLTLALPPENKATAVWPPSGIALAAILLAGYRIWPGVWLGAFLANLWDYFGPANSHSFGTHFAVSSGIAAGSTFQALLGAFLLHRWVSNPISFDRSRNGFLFVGVTLLACLVAATVGVATLVLAGFAPRAAIGFAWWTWWLGDTTGILLVTPLILSWSKRPLFTWKSRQLAEAVLLIALLSGVGLFVFGGWSPWGIVTGSLTYMIVPLLVWATFRFAHHGATGSLLLVSSIAVWGTAQGHGPFVQATLNESLLLLQTFVGVLAMTTLALASILAERRHAQQAWADSIRHLERALHEIRTLHGMVPICAWCKKIRTDAGSWQQLEIYLREHTEAEFSHSICPDCSENRRRAL